MTTTLRRLVPADAAAYRALMLEAYAESADAFTSSVVERAPLPLAWWAARMAEGDAAAERIYGAFDADAIVATAGLKLHDREKLRHKALLVALYVRPAWRGRGLAERLVETIVDAARSLPALKL